MFTEYEFLDDWNFQNKLNKTSDKVVHLSVVVHS